LVAFELRITYFPDSANALRGHDGVHPICDDLAVRRDRMRSGFPPGHRALQLIVLHSQIDRISHELQVLTEGMAVGRGEDALDLAIARVHVDHSASERECAGSFAVN